MVRLLSKINPNRHSLRAFLGLDNRLSTLGIAENATCFSGTPTGIDTYLLSEHTTTCYLRLRSSLGTGAPDLLTPPLSIRDPAGSQPENSLRHFHS